MSQKNQVSPNQGHKTKHKVSPLTLSLLILLLTVTVAGTLAFLVTSSGPIVNSFSPSAVDCEVSETFDGTIKSDVNVKNTGDTDAYVRVKLVSYRVNDNGARIGGIATVPGFTLGENWVKFGDHYYYTKPLAPGAEADTALTATGITLQSYTDADGGNQVIEVMAEAIQSGPARAVEQSWGVSISEGSVTEYTGG